MPIPFFTRAYEFHYTKKLFEINTMARRTHGAKIKFEKARTALMIKIKEQEDLVNLSHLLEATTKSSFQFWFQTILVIPTIIISFTDVEGSINWVDMFNWRIASILISFCTFAVTFYKIRYKVTYNISIFYSAHKNTFFS